MESLNDAQPPLVGRRGNSPSSPPTQKPLLYHLFLSQHAHIFSHSPWPHLLYFPSPPLLLSPFTTSISHPLVCSTMAPFSPYFSITRCTGVRGGVSSLLLRNSLTRLKPAIQYVPFLKSCYSEEELPSLSHKISTCGLKFPCASFSSYASADNEPSKIGVSKEVAETELPGSESEHNMAEAFHISSRTAFAITAMIAFAALTFPFVMKSVSQTVGMKMKVLSYVTILSGFYMAWNIGANDVANAMGTSVGSGALTLRQAVLMAAVLEFSGAFLMGTHVTNTMQKGILVASVFQGKDSLLFAGLLSSLAAAGTWLQVIILQHIPFLILELLKFIINSALIQFFHFSTTNFKWRKYLKCNLSALKPM
jgi:Phosphate transporter family